MSDIVVVSATRTALGRLGGCLARCSAADLGSTAIAGALAQAALDPAEVSDVTMGQVLTAGTGQNPARQAAVSAGIPVEVPATTINMVCGSGLKAVALGMASLQSGMAEIVVAGGQESMSQAPHVALLRPGLKAGNVEFADTMLKDGLICALTGIHMGMTAEKLAQRFSIRREDQDAFAVRSQNKAEVAIAAGRFAEEITPVAIPRQDGGVSLISTDEGPRAGVVLDRLAALKPAFLEGGTVTAGNASGLNDGAAAVVLMREAEAVRRGLTPLGRIASFAAVGVDPEIMGTGPIAASRKALAIAGWSVADLDLIEGNEAFAAQSLAVNRAMGWDEARVNVNGGAIALGHPIGASGCRIFVTLLHEMRRRKARKGLATLCVGGGMGVACCVEGA